METPSQDFMPFGCLDCPIRRFHDEPTSSWIILAVFPQWYEDSCRESLDNIQRYHPL